MISKINSLLIINLILIILSATIYPQNVARREANTLNKVKRELFRKLKVKTETEIRKTTQNDSSINPILIYNNFFDENGNETTYEFYNNSWVSGPSDERDFITDENGNILEAY